MHLEVDLRFDSAPNAAPEAPGSARLDLHTLARAARSPTGARSPRHLWRFLRKERYDVVSVRKGDLRPSALQGACLVFLAAVPTRRFVVDGREHGRTAFALHALLTAVVAVPSEIVRSAVLARRVSLAGRRQVALPGRPDALRTALFVRVDLTLSWLGAQVGGAATHTSGVINGLLDNGVDVQVLAAERPVATERAAFVHVPVKRALQLVPGLAFTDYTEELVRGGSTLAPDFVYQRYQLGSDAGLALAERLGVPLVLEFNGSEIWVQRHWGGERLWFARSLAELERRNLRDASLVVVVSNVLRDTVVAEGAAPERVLVNPNGVDLAELEPYRTGTPAANRARLGLPDEPTVGFVGTFGPWHGVRQLPAIAAAVPEARWIIVGYGDLFAEVRAATSARGLDDRVLMTGLLERPRALELLACCDVCVSPHVPNPDGSPFFGSPTKLFEYMGLRRPIVASDLGQIGEVLTHERTALLVEPGDVEETAAAVRRLLADAELRRTLADAAFDLAAAEYTWTAHVRRILDVLAAGNSRA